MFKIKLFFLKLFIIFVKYYFIMTILFFGQPASGKTTLASSYIDHFGVIANIERYIHIDGDIWRSITNNVNYSKEGRMMNLKSAFDMAIFLEQQGFTPILSFVAPYEEIRKYLSDKSNNCIQIFLQYDGGRGRDMNFAKDFEVSNGEVLKLNTSLHSIEDCLIKINDYVAKKSSC
jgi:GTPase SAR1 family protein